MADNVNAVNGTNAAALPAAAAGAPNVSEAKTSGDQSTYETAPSKGNWWSAFMCNMGRGIYSWRNDTCQYNKHPNWRR